jgi:hypothetical protein
MGIKKADVKRKKSLKILLYGDASSGKTHLALNATPGKTLIFDADSGADLFEGRKGFDFDYWTDDNGLKTASIKELMKAIAYLATPDGRQKYDTFIVDPISDIWDNLQFQRGDYKDAQAVKRGKTRQNEADIESFNQKDWGDVKKVYKNVMLDLKGLPQNIFLIAREKEILENKADGSIVKTGEYTYDAEKNTKYSVDFCIRLVMDKKTKKRYAEIDKTRSEGLETGQRVDNPTFELFAKVVNLMSDGKTIKPQNVPTENIFADGTASVTVNEEDELKELQGKVLELCNKLAVQNGGDKAPIKAVIAEFAEGKTNPNSIKELSKLNELFVKLQTMDKEN